MIGKKLLRYSSHIKNIRKCVYTSRNSAKCIVRHYSEIEYLSKDMPLNFCTEFRILSQHSNILSNIKKLLECDLCNIATLNANQNAIHELAETFISTTSPKGDHHERKAELIKVLNFLVSHGCSIEDIREKGIDYINESDCSYVKTMLLPEIDSDILKLLPLMSLSVTSLRLAAKRSQEDKTEIKNFPNRIAYLCYHFELSSAELMRVLSKHSTLLTMKFERLEHKMNVLKNAKISPKYIAKDLWIFNYNEKLLASRIQAAEKAGIELKPWMLRCSKRTFESHLGKYSETQRILNGEDVVSYLAKKLDCSKDYVIYIMQKQESLKSINIPKIEEIINFLYEKGYTPQEVRIFPRILCSSFNTLKKRFEEFRKLKSTLPTTAQLCTSAKTFEKVLKQKKE
ncbi:uncharacterized protein LOC118195981 [Stegodyphus dumicola]|uniref:uncharacterized protein LOC118195981 n=1 Tax=Stegodyphus dumicola TaxID=202533 RepID=UPI0015B19AEB|nr:uncharacterized protein LOC118195981 [Stegodyphus dumicola]XP_035223223.1 uncharacterized protein LOC118195981 [Stegodyphus dumicola]